MDTDLLSDTFVDLADTMVADFDVIDFLHMLTDRSTRLPARPATRGRSLQRGGRPGRAGRSSRGPRFAVAASQAGFGAVHALPMRLRDQVIGALNLFSTDTGPLGVAELRIGQALADVATISLLQERNVRRAETLAEQLQAALNSRVVIEQAKGRLAERLGLDMDQAFTLLREHARNTNQRLTDVARYITKSATADFPPSAARQPRPTGARRNNATAEGRAPLDVRADKAASDLWWKNAVIYCADVATWADSDGDGTDDLAGLTRRGPGGVLAGSHGCAASAPGRSG